MYKKKLHEKGFTLIELLIVIAIIAILSAVVFVALDPLTRFRDARDSRRWSDASSLLNAIKIHQVDNGGSYLATISGLTSGTVYMVGTGGASGCDAQNTYCKTNSNAACVDLSGLVTGGYLGSVPISPNGAGSWTANITGYTLTRASTGIITVRACEGENMTGEISVSR